MCAAIPDFLLTGSDSFRLDIVYGIRLIDCSPFMFNTISKFNLPYLVAAILTFSLMFSFAAKKIDFSSVIGIQNPTEIISTKLLICSVYKTNVKFGRICI